MGIYDRDYMRDRYRQRQGLGEGRTQWNYKKAHYRPASRQRFNAAGKLVLLLSALTILIPAYREAKRSGWIPDREVELPFPASGTVTVNNSVDPKTATSSIEVTAAQANAVVQLFDRETDVHFISVYVNRNQDVSVPVPPGTYRMRIVEGDKWHGLTTWFGASTTYETVIQPMLFTHREYHKIDLHRSPAGNLHTSINITNPKPLN